MRIHRRVLVSTLVLSSAWLTVWGCYSSNAPIPTAGAGDDDDDDTPGGDSGPDVNPCTPRKPWEGPGVTAMVRASEKTWLVVNGDRYVIGEFDTSGSDPTDPNMGRLVAWREKGMLSEIWAAAPAALGFRPWDSPGITAAYPDKVTGKQVLISQYRRWFVLNDDWSIVANPQAPGPNPGNITDDLGLANNAGPPIEDGGRAPWEGPGITGAAFIPNGSRFFVISQDREWIRITDNSDPTKWTWMQPPDAGGAYPLSTINPWNTAPLVGGQRPYDGKGVTAVAYIKDKMFVFSGDKMWATNGTTWSNSGMLQDLDIWKSAPAVGCGQ